MFLAMAPVMALAGGPIGRWMLTDGDNRTDAIIQGNGVQTFAQAGGTTLQYPIQWDPSFNVFETVGRDQNGRGGVYTPSHQVVGNFGNFNSEPPPEQTLDGTLDTGIGRTLAAVFGPTSGIIEYNDAFFDSPSTLLWSDGGADDVWSVTYAQSNGLVYVGQNNFITVITDTGVTVGSFGAFGGGPVRSLAYDINDNSLWYLSFDGSTAIQSSLTGQLLQTMTVNLGGNYWGGEIAPFATPEPAPIAALGLGVLALVRRRRSRK